MHILIHGYKIESHFALKSIMKLMFMFSVLSRNYTTIITIMVKIVHYRQKKYFLILWMKICVFRPAHQK